MLNLKRKRTGGPISQQIVLESSLQTFFFDELIKYNKRHSVPLSSETIYYVSRLLDQYALCENFFEEVDGKIQEKVLGVKLLETFDKSPRRKIDEIRDVGDTALMLCGFFPDSMNKKIVSPQYYYKIGMSAYRNLNRLIPIYMDQKNFYQNLSDLFYRLAELLTILAESFQNENLSYILDAKALKAG